jgi:hypothetical protein
VAQDADFLIYGRQQKLGLLCGFVNLHKRSDGKNHKNNKSKRN